jgi:hypothetical protein
MVARRSAAASVPLTDARVIKAKLDRTRKERRLSWALVRVVHLTGFHALDGARTLLKECRSHVPAGRDMQPFAANLRNAAV